METTTEVTELQNIDGSNKIHPATLDVDQTVQPPPEYEGDEGKKHLEAFVCRDSGSVLGGKDNPMFILNEETKNMESVTPSLTYIDFLPKLLLNSENKDQLPQFSRFGTLIEEANAWLQDNIEFTVWKCETVLFKLENDNSVNKESVLYMESAYGITKFLVGLRLWLVPQRSDAMPVVQIGYTTALPSRSDEDFLDDEMNCKVEVSPSFTLRETISILNKQFMKKPLPGVILNVENVLFRVSHDVTEKARIDPNQTCWAENGSKQRTIVHGVRVFFLNGSSDFGKIGYHDELPDILPGMGALVKYGPFQNVVRRMGLWMKEQKNIRVVNMQSIDVKCGYDSQGSVQIDPDKCGHVEVAYTENRYSKVLRAFYVVTSKSDVKPYQSVNLHTRLFTPVRIAGKNFESFPKTIQRMMKWMNYTKVPPFAVETIQYQVYAAGDGNPVHEDKVDSLVRRNVGRHQLSTIRLYLPSEFTEPPPEVTPEVATSYASSWGCTIS